jgi:hypothetical protein
MEVAPEESLSRRVLPAPGYAALSRQDLPDCLLHLLDVCRVQTLRSLHDIEFYLFAL